jgi:hypothetical protein
MLILRPFANEQETRYYLEKCQEKVQLLFGRTTIKAVAASVQESASQANSEEIIRKI